MIWEHDVGYDGSARRGVWRSLVARFVRDEEVVGSNPATPTEKMCTSGPFFGRVLVRLSGLIDHRTHHEPTHVTYLHVRGRFAESARDHASADHNNRYGNQGRSL